MERMLEDYDAAHGIKSISFRYFNAAGAALDGSIGENHPEESHLIPNAIKSALTGAEFTLFGNDYETPDGTTIRDYVHVLDIAESHILGLEKLLAGGESNIYNIGLGKGHSNKEVLDEIGRVAGTPIKVKVGEKRPGDAKSLYASIEKIGNDLGWKPKYSLTEIVESAFKWHKAHPNGY